MVSHASHHGWSNTSGGGTQYFDEHVCYYAQGSRATGCGVCTRYHFRVSHYGEDGSWGVYSIATPHHEDFTSCGHAVDSNDDEPPGGFVMGRNRFWYTWYPSHSWQTWQYWSNTAPQQQCDGGWAWNDGWVDFWYIP